MHVEPKGGHSCADYGRSAIIMESKRHRKPLFWVGSSKKDLSAFPYEVKLVMGFALHLAQTGGKHVDAKTLKGFKGAGVLEVVEEHDGNAYRAVYTVRLADCVYVLHAFQKKSKKGIATPKSEIDLIKERLKRAEQDHEQRSKSRK
jgi:phage-related protein